MAFELTLDFYSAQMYIRQRKRSYCFIFSENISHFYNIDFIYVIHGAHSAMIHTCYSHQSIIIIYFSTHSTIKGNEEIRNVSEVYRKLENRE